jgi:hypothetical protein
VTLAPVRTSTFLLLENSAGVYVFSIELSPTIPPT